MDFRELEYFVTIAREKNLTRASEQLYISQPALTKYLQRLEQEHGLTFFNRIGKQLQLTYAGEKYLNYVNQLLSVKRSMDQEMADIHKNSIGILNVGMPPFRCSVSLPVVLPRFHRLYPNVRVEVTDSSSAHLDELLLAGQLDLVIYNSSEYRKGISYETIRQEELFAICKKGHPLKEKAIHREGQPDGILLKALENEILILQERSARHGEYIHNELEKQHITPARTQYISNVGASAALAANGYGIAFLSGGLIHHILGHQEYDCYALLDVARPIHLVAAWRQGSYLPIHAATFIQLLKDAETIDENN